jgi:HPt (histidine-containing phosphotransfer) domain-containing protein
MSADLDLERLRMLADLGRRTEHDLVAEILERFEASQTVERALEAARDADIETSTLHLHSLKGSAANLGARRLSSLSAALEVEVRSGAGFEALRARFEDLRSAHHEALRELKSFIAANRTNQTPPTP